MSKRAMIPAGYLHFLWAGLVKHPQTGALLPSQRFLIDQMIAPVPEDYHGQIVELGAGHGCLTVRLAARCPEARILVCEINPILARDTRLNLARAGVNGRVKVVTSSAQDLLATLAEQPAEKPGYIISGLPLGNFNRKSVLGLLHLVSRALAEPGMFIQVQHLLLDRKKIQAAFPALRTVPVLLNFPPAFVYYAQKPAGG